jgi:dsRNA-specific ribonuclease|tara:strand:+ start:2099 stop:3106 length:1008 start_codon:yes stop_codon:yes gene_type:complete
MNNDDDIRIEKNSTGTDTYIFDPYNPQNKVITKTDIQIILSKYGINVPIYNELLYKRAFVHRSYIKRPQLENKQNNIIIVDKPDDCLSLYTKSNERLEFVGDGVLECITKFYLYRRFPKENEGFMTEKKIALVKNEAIGRIAYEMGLHKWLILSKHAELKQTRTNLKKLGCIFESFIGAMFLDFNKISVEDNDEWFKSLFVTGPGFQMVQIFVESIFEQHVDWISLIKNDDNYKNILQVKIQKEYKVTPEYMEVKEHNSEHGFHMGVYLCLGQPIHSVSHKDALSIRQFKTHNDVHLYMSQYKRIFIYLGGGVHNIKKKAEQTACEEAIRNLTNF